MKILVVCLLLSTLSLTFAAVVTKESDEVSTMLQSFARAESDQDMEDNEEADSEDIATLQGVFNVLAQVNEEKAKIMDNNNAMIQFWGLVKRGLFNYGKKYLKRKYCSEEEEVQAMLQELDGEQEEDKEDEALAELQTLFNTLKKAEAKVMLGSNKAEAEGFFKKIGRWAKKKLKRVSRKYLCYL